MRPPGCADFVKKFLRVARAALQLLVVSDHKGRAAVPFTRLVARRDVDEEDAVLLQNHAWRGMQVRSSPPSRSQAWLNLSANFDLHWCATSKGELFESDGAAYRPISPRDRRSRIATSQRNTLGISSALSASRTPLWWQADGRRPSTCMSRRWMDSSPRCSRGSTALRKLKSLANSEPGLAAGPGTRSGRR